jgi:hypothetical protein
MKSTIWSLAGGLLLLGASVNASAQPQLKYIKIEAKLDKGSDSCPKTLSLSMPSKTTVATRDTSYSVVIYGLSELTGLLASPGLTFVENRTNPWKKQGYTQSFRSDFLRPHAFSMGITGVIGGASPAEDVGPETMRLVYRQLAGKKIQARNCIYSGRRVD